MKSAATVVRAGITLESALRGVYRRSLQMSARWSGLASRSEVERMRELTRALEYRIEVLEEELREERSQ